MVSIYLQLTFEAYFYVAYITNWNFIRLLYIVFLYNLTDTGSFYFKEWRQTIDIHLLTKLKTIFCAYSMNAIGKKRISDVISNMYSYFFQDTMLHLEHIFILMWNFLQSTLVTHLNILPST